MKSDFMFQNFFILGLGLIITLAFLWVINTITKDIKNQLEDINDQGETTCLQCGKENA
jgi:hypothetical protein